MGEHKTVDELVARVTNQSIEIERMRCELRSVKMERNHWIEVCADLRGQLEAARKELVPPLVRRTQEQLEALGFQFKAEPSIVEEVKPCNHPVLTDPYANELRPRWAWWRRVFGGA